MKFVRFGPPGGERPGVVTDDATIYDISSLVPDIGAETLESLDDLMQRVAATDGLPTVDASSVRLGPPLARPHKILGVGLNYADHAAESGMELPTSPIVFSKATSALSGPTDDLILPPDADKLDWEVELGVVIGRTARRLPDSNAAADVIAGYTIVNDVSERAWQLEESSQWMLGKSHDSFCPTGPWLVTPDEVGAVDELALTCAVNGDIRQSGSTASMIFDVYQVVWFLSQRLTLEPGDLIATGTPPGVGLATGTYLVDGDVVELEVTRLGRQRTVVRSLR
jgi:2-keto-4-pentenoate hydratase/2-oxohepta-3-ene-1,7-dioic acid hydratase in catechol pathway